MPIAVVIGQPALDTIASMVSFPGVDDWDILGGFYGEPAKLVKCETNDLTVPANTLWGILMGHLRNYAETAKPVPAFN